MLDRSFIPLCGRCRGGITVAWRSRAQLAAAVLCYIISFVLIDFAVLLYQENKEV